MIFPNSDPSIEVEVRDGVSREPRWLRVRFWLCTADPARQVVSIVPLVIVDGAIRPVPDAKLREFKRPDYLT